MTFIDDILENDKIENEKESRQKQEIKKKFDVIFENKGFTFDDIQKARDAGNDQRADYIKDMFESAAARHNGVMPERVCSFAGNNQPGRTEATAESQPGETGIPDWMIIRKVLYSEGLVEKNLETVAKGKSPVDVIEYILIIEYVENLTIDMLSWLKKKNGQPYLKNCLEEYIKRAKRVLRQKNEIEMNSKRIRNYRDKPI